MKHEKKKEIKTVEVKKGASSSAFLGLCAKLDAAKAFTGIPASRTQPEQPKAEPGEDHPRAARKNTLGKSTDLTESQMKRLRHESINAKEKNIPWEERGPAQDLSKKASYNDAAKSSSVPEVLKLRGQHFRSGAFGGKSRYAKRGGKYKEYYDKLNKAGLLQPTPKGAVRVHDPADMPW